MSRKGPRDIGGGGECAEEDRREMVFDDSDGDPPEEVNESDIEIESVVVEDD